MKKIILIIALSTSPIFGGTFRFINKTPNKIKIFLATSISPLARTKKTIDIPPQQEASIDFDCIHKISIGLRYRGFKFGTYTWDTQKVWSRLLPKCNGIAEITLKPKPTENYFYIGFGERPDYTYHLKWIK